MVAIDGSKFKASNSRDLNYTTGKLDKRQEQIEESVQRYLDLIETADRTSPIGFSVKTVRLYKKIARLRLQMRELALIRKQLEKQPEKQLSMTDPDARSMATSRRGSDIDSKSYLRMSCFLASHRRRSRLSAGFPVTADSR